MVWVTLAQFVQCGPSVCLTICAVSAPACLPACPSVCSPSGATMASKRRNGTATLCPALGASSNQLSAPAGSLLGRHPLRCLLSPLAKAASNVLSSPRCPERSLILSSSPQTCSHLRRMQPCPFSMRGRKRYLCTILGVWIIIFFLQVNYSRLGCSKAQMPFKGC